MDEKRSKIFSLPSRESRSRSIEVTALSFRRTAAIVVFDGMRNVVFGRGVSLVALSWGACLAVAYLVLACWFFTLIFRRAVRVGLIARYSAENVG